MSLDAGWVRLPLIAGLALLAGARFVLSATYFSDETEGQMKGDKQRYSVKQFLFHLFETVWNGLAGALVAGVLADGVSSDLQVEHHVRGLAPLVLALTSSTGKK